MNVGLSERPVATVSRPTGATFGYPHVETELGRSKETRRVAKLTMTKIIAGGVRIAALAAAAPTAAQIDTDSAVGAQAQLASKQCVAAVQNRLNNSGYGAINASGSAG